MARRPKGTHAFTMGTRCRVAKKNCYGTIHPYSTFGRNDACIHCRYSFWCVKDVIDCPKAPVPGVGNPAVSGSAVSITPDEPERPEPVSTEGAVA